MNAPIDPKLRLERNTVRAGDCVVWNRSRDHKGYGLLKTRGVSWRTHRLAWTLFVGPIPEGIHVLHKCDNPPCCKIEHLFLGTNLDNVRDRMSKGRGTTLRGERNHNAKLTDAEVSQARSIFVSRKMSCAELAESLSIDRTSAWQIVTGRTRKDAGGPIVEAPERVLRSTDATRAYHQSRSEKVDKVASRARRNERAKDRYWENIEANRAKAREKQCGYRESKSARSP